MQPKITCFCPALGHPELLARAIACFEHQTYENRELVIIEDGGQLDSQSGDRWEIVAVKRRFRSLAEKNNACIALASRDSNLFQKYDLDDVYLPWALEASVEALSRGPICQPRKAMMETNDGWVVTPTHGEGRDSLEANFCFHGCWSMTRAFFNEMRGYQPGIFSGDDQELDRLRRAKRIKSVGLSPEFKPFYFYHRTPGQISRRGDSEQAYYDCAANVTGYVGKLPPYDGPPVWEWPIPTKVLERRAW